jgi:hypothetical protein
MAAARWAMHNAKAHQPTLMGSFQVPVSYSIRKLLTSSVDPVPIPFYATLWLHFTHLAPTL